MTHRFPRPALFAGLLSLVTALPAGIPEPSLTLYGVVRQDLGGATARLTTGTLEVTYTPTVGAPLTLTTTLTNLNNQFSYALEIPFESSVPGFPASADALELTVVASAFTRAPVSVDGIDGQILPPASTNVSYGQTSRGTFERMDIVVAVPFLDTDNDGLPNDFETLYFGNATGMDPNADNDVGGPDGFTNLEEFLAGTNPNDTDSVLWMQITPQSGGTLVEWRGAPERTYRVRRSTRIDGGFSTIASGLAYVDPTNAFLDTSASPDTIYFYLIEVE